jgi:cob(I)alamin adenosyltransferase
VLTGGDRLSGPIYTRRGDKGDTSLADGTRVPKDSPRVRAYGTIDEANSQVGLALSSTDEPLLCKTLTFVQHRLFNCAGNLATLAEARTGDTPSIDIEDVHVMETTIDRMTEVTGDLDGFTIPGGCETASRLHVACTVVRRAEREVRALARDEQVDALVLAFVNRLSDLLFAAARYANAVAGLDDTRWDATAGPPE